MSQVLLMLAAGLVVGVLARVVVPAPRLGVVTTVAVGVLGGLVGGVVGGALVDALEVGTGIGWLVDLLCSVAGAALVLVGLQAAQRR